MDRQRRARHADWANFYRQAATKGFIFGDPRAVKGSPGQAQAMVEMYRKMAEIGGIAYETETSVKLDGSGPMAGLMAKMGGVTTTTTVTDVNAGAARRRPLRRAGRLQAEGAQVILAALNTSSHVVAVELRPPRAELEAAAGIDAWIDTYHAIRGLVRQNVRVMVTDSAVGAQEENNLRHLVTNLGPDVPRTSVVPFLTTKHSIDFCLGYADQVVQHGFPALVVLGGDKHVGRAALGRTRLAAAAAHSRAPSRAAARRLGEPGRRSGPPGGVRAATASSPPTST